MEVLVRLADRVAVRDLLDRVGCAPLFGSLGSAGLAWSWRSLAQSTAKPVFRTPPGYSVVWVWSITESGEIAARSGGCVWAVKS